MNVWVEGILSSIIFKVCINYRTHQKNYFAASRGPIKCLPVNACGWSKGEEAKKNGPRNKQRNDQFVFFYRWRCFSCDKTTSRSYEGLDFIWNIMLGELPHRRLHAHFSTICWSEAILIERSSLNLEKFVNWGWGSWSAVVHCLRARITRQKPRRFVKTFTSKTPLRDGKQSPNLDYKNQNLAEKL